MKYSVKTKLIAVILIVFAVAAASFSYISYVCAKRSAEAAVLSLIDRSAASAEEALSGRIEAITAVTDDLSVNDAAFNRAVDEIRLRLLTVRNESCTADGMCFDIAYVSSLRSIDGVTDYSDNEAVKSAASGTPLMTAPYRKNGKSVVCYASPLTEPYDDRLCVLICTADSGFFDEVFDSISLGGSCAVYVSDENGIVAGQASETDGTYSASAPVDSRNGWSINVEAVPSELMPDMTKEIAAPIILSAVLAAVLCAVTALVLGKTLSPIKKMSDRISALADGDFTSPVPEVRTRDESYEMACALKKTTDALGGCVSEIAASISNVAQGDISDSASAYSGDFAVIYRALSDMKSSLGNMLAQVRRSSDTVIDSAEKLGEAVPVPRQSSEESIRGVFDDCSDISEYAEKTAASFSVTREKLDEEREKLFALRNIMTEAGKQTKDITEVVTRIDDIAFRTNILSLNAAVEAASAGEHGRSFAVVADEVRSLAQQSSVAAKSTEQLIEKTVSLIMSGSLLAGETYAILDRAFECADETAGLMDGLKAAAREYTEAAKTAEETLLRLSEEALEYASPAPADAEKTEKIVDEAIRLRKLADSFRA